MPCVAMNTPAIKVPGASWEPRGCGASTTATLASPATASAAVRPLPTRATAMTPSTTITPTTATVLLPSASVYERFWRFLAHHWHAQPHQASEQPSQHQRRRRSRTSPSRLSASSEMRCRVQILHELEAAIPRDLDDANDGRDVLLGQSHGHHSRHVSRGAMQTTCCNCGQRFFRDLGTAPSVSEDAAAAKSSRSAYCSLDCRSSSEYRAAVQHAVDHNAAFGSPSPSMTSRL